MENTRPTMLSMVQTRRLGAKPLHEQGMTSDWTIEDWDRWVVAIQADRPFVSYGKSVSESSSRLPTPSSPRIRTFREYMRKAGERSFQEGEPPGLHPDPGTGLGSFYSDGYRPFDLGYMEAMAVAIRALARAKDVSVPE